MGKINLLSFEVANLIAAGEVVDRPSSAVKELLENAIDSGANQITLEIQRGGVTFIRVADNGCGIEKEDLVPAITRHSTSKIKNAEDLDSIATLGFRGEALAAIASVSRLRIFSKVPGQVLGAVLEAEGGSGVTISDTGCREGTTVIVEDLFFNVPARRKFLKKDSTEAVAIGAVMEKIALSHPGISFKFISDGEVKFVTSGNGDLRETIWALFGKDTAKRALKCDREENGIRVSGFVSEPDVIRSNRNMENFFINGRYIKSKTASAALEEAYVSRIPADKFPFCVLNISLNPAAVDVNVHPAKLEVKFANEKLIFDAVYYAVLSALDAEASRPELSLGKNNGAQNTQASADNASSRAPKAQSYSNAFIPADGKKSRPEQVRLGDTPVAANYGNSTDSELAEAHRKAAENIRNAINSAPAVSISADVPESGQNTTPGDDDAPLTHIKPQRSPAEIAAEMLGMTKPTYAPSQPQSQAKPKDRTNDISSARGDESATIPDDVLLSSEPPEPAPKTGFMPFAFLGANDLAEASASGNVTLTQTPPTQKVQEIKQETAEKKEEKTEADKAQTDAYAIYDEEIRQSDVPEYIILGEAFNCYVIVQLSDRLLMIDKHAAHERIIFDELCRKMRKHLREKASHCGQLLLAPIEAEILTSERDVLTEYSDRLTALGFDYSFEKKGVSTYTVKITQIPEDLEQAAALELFSVLLSRLSDSTGTVESATEGFFETRLWQASCKAAIKGGRVYDIAHIKWICDRLLRKPDAENKVIRTCPHGRPVAFEIKKSSIDRQFARLT